MTLVDNAVLSKKSFDIMQYKWCMTRLSEGLNGSNVSVRHLYTAKLFSGMSVNYKIMTMCSELVIGL